MTKNKKVRIELRYDEVEDKDMIDFIDKYGSTRAGFIKQVLKIYKNKIETITPDTLNNEKTETENKNIENQKKKRLLKDNDSSISRKDFD